MRKPQIIIGILLGAVLLVLGACGPAPAEFEVISLDIEPPEAVTGETVTITAVVNNIGGSEGTYAAVLTVDGATVETKEVAITPGSSKVVIFSLVKDAPGTYEIRIGELSSSLTVAPAPPEFEVISLDIEPAEAVAGETVSITALVKNIGGSEGTYTAVLTLDGVTVEAKEVAITPGSSKVVTFSLVKDEPGTYEIGIGELSSSLTVIIKEVELKYDDGQPDGHLAIGRAPGTGYLVHFSPPSIPFTVTEIKIFGNLYGTGYESLEFTVEIWDKEQKTIHTASYPHTKFSLSPAWLEIDVPNVVVDGAFYIHVFTHSPPEGGVNIGYDSSVKNEHSEMTRNWEIVWWSGSPKETVNWMIRVVGTPAEQGTPVTSPVTPPSAQTIEVSEEFRETLSSLDSPQKLSRWMLDNIQYESHYEIYKETGIHDIASPEETFGNRKGCCSDFAVFACYVLEYHGYEAEILSIAVESDPSKGHAVCVYQSSGSLYTINVGRIEGPYQTYEDIAFAHHKDWSRYRVFCSWMNFQESGRPDKIVYRE